MTNKQKCKLNTQENVTSPRPQRLSKTTRTQECKTTGTHGSAVRSINSYIALETVWHYLPKMNECIPNDPAIPFLDIQPTYTSTYGHQKTYRNIISRIIHNSPKLEIYEYPSIVK